MTPISLYFGGKFCVARMGKLYSQRRVEYYIVLPFFMILVQAYSINDVFVQTEGDLFSHLDLLTQLIMNCILNFPHELHFAYPPQQPETVAAGIKI